VKNLLFILTQQGTTAAKKKSCEEPNQPALVRPFSMFFCAVWIKNSWRTVFLFNDDGYEHAVDLVDVFFCLVSLPVNTNLPQLVQKKREGSDTDDLDWALLTFSSSPSDRPVESNSKFSASNHHLITAKAGRKLSSAKNLTKLIFLDAMRHVHFLPVRSSLEPFMERQNQS
jgi:hypothetical protein